MAAANTPQSEDERPDLSEWTCCDEHCLTYPMGGECQKCVEEYDPSPWCAGCGAMKQQDCACGPIAENN